MTAKAHLTLEERSLLDLPTHLEPDTPGTACQYGTDTAAVNKQTACQYGTDTAAVNKQTNKSSTAVGSYMLAMCIHVARLNTLQVHTLTVYVYYI